MILISGLYFYIIILLQNHTQDFGLPVLLPSIPSNCRGKLLFTLGDDHSVEWTIITWPSMPCPIILKILKCFYAVYCALRAQLPNPETQGLHTDLSVIHHFQLWCFYSHLSVLSIQCIHSFQYYCDYFNLFSLYHLDNSEKLIAGILHSCLVCFPSVIHMSTRVIVLNTICTLLPCLKLVNGPNSPSVLSSDSPVRLCIYGSPLCSIT